MLEEMRLIHKDVPSDHQRLLGELYLRQGFTREATDILLVLYEDKPFGQSDLKQLLEALVRLGASQEVTRFANILLKKAPDDAQTNYYCALACELR